MIFRVRGTTRNTSVVAAHSLLRDAAEGMAYLHDELDTIHRDLGEHSFSHESGNGRARGQDCRLWPRKFCPRTRRERMLLSRQRRNTHQICLRNSPILCPHLITFISRIRRRTLPPAAHRTPAPPKRVTGSEDGQASTVRPRSVNRGTCGNDDAIVIVKVCGDDATWARPYGWRRK